MAKKQVKLVPEAAPAPAAPAKSQPVNPKTPRIQTAKHSKSPAIVESPAAQPDLTHEAIASVAYGYWESRGYRGGDALDDWFRAEAELKRVTIH
jgi:hypothetical protein